jgi:hypothetical protein
MEYPESNIDRIAVPLLLKAGFHHVHLSVGFTAPFGCPLAMKYFDSFYRALVSTYHLQQRAVLIGLSRGGLYAHRLACEHPERVSVVYGDTRSGYRRAGIGMHRMCIRMHNKTLKFLFYFAQINILLAISISRIENICKKTSTFQKPNSNFINFLRKTNEKYVLGNITATFAPITSIVGMR